MPEIKRIACTTDFSTNAECAFPMAIDLARKYGATLSLVYVHDEQAYAYPETWGVLDVSGWLNPFRLESERRLLAQAAELGKNSGLNITPVFLEGSVVSELLTYITDRQIDLLVISTHGRTGLSHLVFGSVAGRLVQLSPCPVLSVRPPKPVKSKKVK